MYVDADDQPEDDERIMEVAIDQSVTCGQLEMNPFYTEHHFRGPWHSSPLQFASYIAPKLPPDCYQGFAVLSTPYYNPVRLVEGMNMLDQLTKGHALFGLGSGFPGIEPSGMGLTVEHHGSSRASDEAIEVMQRLWDFKNGDVAYEYQTERYSGTLVKRVVPAPYHKHHPHVIVTARRPSALRRAAENGWPIFVGVGAGDDEVLEQLSIYRSALATAGHPQEVIDECMRWSCYDLHDITVADSDEEAQANAERGRIERNIFRDKATARNRRLEEVNSIAAELGERGPQTSGYGRSRAGGHAATPVGNPDTVARRIQQISDWGVSHILLRFTGEWSGETRDVAEKSMRLFHQEVMPRFRDIAPLADPLAVDLNGLGELQRTAATH